MMDARGIRNLMKKFNFDNISWLIVEWILSITLNDLVALKII